MFLQSGNFRLENLTEATRASEKRTRAKKKKKKKRFFFSSCRPKTVEDAHIPFCPAVASPNRTQSEIAGPERRFCLSFLSVATLLGPCAESSDASRP